MTEHVNGDFDAITRRVDLLREQAAIAAAKEKEALYNFKSNRWDCIVKISKDLLTFCFYSIIVVSFFGSLCFGCYTSNHHLSDESVLAKEGLRRVIVKDVKDEYGNTVWKWEKIPEND